ncbi:uncharacterized protein [Leptinotarsa decemlineata]|uniref:uncharacterized protein n=1 Tax=Leptinotarsa decemlineata TaxID=7539 RepID=UPI003D3045D7
MSKLAKPSSVRGSKPSLRKSSAPQAKPAAKKPPEKEKKESIIPAFSILPKKKEGLDWEALKKQTIRRLAPEGEDIKEIRKILKELQTKKIPVHDFINLVSPYTGDNGATLRSVMAEHVESFQKIAKKVYETMTQDVSDVLVNEQLNMVQFYQEKLDLMMGRMMRSINRIYEMAPEFDFEKYHRNKNEYLQTILPLPVLIQRTEEDLEMQKRQEAYHRLQWLRSEGGRMNEENKRLQQRLEELKKQQREERKRAAEAAAQAEVERQNLVQEESQVKEQLDKLNESVEKSIIGHEAAIKQQHNETATSKGAVKKQLQKKQTKPKKKKPEWVTETAREMEEIAIEESMVNEAESFGRPRRRGMETPEYSRRQEPPREKSPFHFSPDYGVPQPQEPTRERLQDTRIEQAQVTVQQRRQFPARPGRPPQDTWGGFY